MRYVLVLTASLFACRQEDPRQEPSKPSNVTEKVSIQHKASFAHFVDGELFECIDATASTDSGIDEIAKAFFEVTRINVSCQQAFPDRYPLGTCTITKEASSLVSSFYDFETVGLSDEQMVDCLKLRGAWRGISRDSREFTRANLEYHQRNLKKAADGLSRLRRP